MTQTKWDELTLLYKFILRLKLYYILMSDVNNVNFNTLPKSYRKLKNIEDDVGQMNVDRKRTEEGKKLNQNKC